MSPDVRFFTILIILGVGAAAAALGRRLVKLAQAVYEVASQPHLPRSKWETGLPITGRWLRYFFLAGIIPLAAFCFAISILAGFTAVGFLGVFFGQP